MSHPVRVRGLKHKPYSWHPRLGWVAPRAGAWIETYSSGLTSTYCVSHPVRVRGLKHNPAPPRRKEASVAPRAGAWIETYLPKYLRI